MGRLYLWRRRSEESQFFAEEVRDSSRRPLENGWCASLLLLCLASGCQQRAKQEQPSQRPISPVQVQLVQPKRGSITRSVVLPGNVFPNQQAMLFAKVSGYLKSIAVDKGDEVQAGAVVAEIEAPELLADAARYKAEMDLAKVDYDRTVDAQKKAPDLVVIQSLDTAKAKFEMAKANLEHAQTLINYCKIVAPFAGTITKRSVDPGAFIAAATSGGTKEGGLLELMDFKTIRVRVAVPESEVPLIKIGVPVAVTLEEMPGKAFTASVTRFAQALDENTKTMLAEIDIKNPDGELRPGMYVAAKMGVETRTNALLVPMEALMVEKAGSSVFLVEQGKAKKLPVKTGFSDGKTVEVLDGLKEGEPVIVIGKQQLANGQPVNAK